MARWGWRLVFATTLFLGGALANWNDTSTGIDLDKLPHFPLTEVRVNWSKDSKRASFDGITVTTGPLWGEAKLEGIGKSGKPWAAHLSGVDEVRRADLDGNGTQDYVVFGPGPYFNGRLAPPFSLKVLLMDGQGLPVPFFRTLYHGENGEGAKRFVDLNHDGRAELLDSDYDEDAWDRSAGFTCSGHWVTRLYLFRNLRAEEVRGLMGGNRFPFVHKWTYGAEACAPGPPPVIQPLAIPKYENAELTTEIRDSRDVNEIAIDPVAGCKSVNPGTIVYDTVRDREVVFPMYPVQDAATSVLERIQREHAVVKLRGFADYGKGRCLTEVLWASH